MASMIVDPADFIPAEHILFTKPKINAKGGKSIGIINSATKRSLQLSFPLMLNYGAQRYDNDDGTYKLVMSLQFPRDEFANEETRELLKTMKEFENKKNRKNITIA